MLRFVAHFGMNYISLSKLSTIVSKSALRQYDFTTRPTIVYTINSDNVTGHVGLIVRKSGIRKIHIQ